MDNLKEQLGYYNADLNTFVYHDTQLGANPLSDLWGSITGGIKTTVNSKLETFKGQIKDLPADAKERAMSQFLKTGTGEAAVAQAKETWIGQQQENARVFYVNNKNSINTVLAGTALVLTGYIVYRAMSGRKTVAAANPRRKRRNRRRSR